MSQVNRRPGKKKEREIEMRKDKFKYREKGTMQSVGIISE